MSALGSNVEYDGPDIVSIAPAAELDEAMQKMQKHGIRHLPVIEGGRLMGIVSDRDLAFIESLLPYKWTTISVAEAMTPDPYTARADTPIAEVAQVMAQHKYGCAVITDAAGAVCGVFTTVDALSLLSRWAPDRSVADALSGKPSLTP